MALRLIDPSEARLRLLWCYFHFSFSFSTSLCSWSIVAADIELSISVGIGLPFLVVRLLFVCYHGINSEGMVYILVLWGTV